MFWVVFPLLAFIFLLLTFIMVITPMKKPEKERANSAFTSS